MRRPVPSPAGEKERKMQNTRALVNALENQLADMIEKKIISSRSSWDRGVNAYSEELIGHIRENARYIDFISRRNVESVLLNGSDNWSQYSWGGCSLIYDGDIAERLCAPSELKKTHGGEHRPNAREEWLDLQARALYQAAIRVREALDALNLDAFEIAEDERTEAADYIA